MEFPTLSVVRPAHPANQSATAAEVTDRLWGREVARHYHQMQGLTEFRQGSLVLVAPSGNCDAQDDFLVDKTARKVRKKRRSKT
jgi:hypothetical protein